MQLTQKDLQSIYTKAINSNDPEVIHNTIQEINQEVLKAMDEFEPECGNGLKEKCNYLAEYIVNGQDLNEALHSQLEELLGIHTSSCINIIPNTELKVSNLTTDINQALHKQCLDEEVSNRNQNCAKDFACVIGSTLAGPILAGLIEAKTSQTCINTENNCLVNILTSLTDYLISSIKSIWNLLDLGVNWLKERGKNFWNKITSAEDETNKAQELIQNLSQEDIDEIDKNPQGWFTRILSGTLDFFKEWFKTEVFCQEWKGAPNYSQCLDPLKGFECLNCGTMLTGMCQMIGPVVGIFAETILTGGALALIGKGAQGVNATTKLMKNSKAYQAGLDRVKNTSFGSEIIRSQKMTVSAGIIVDRTKNGLKTLSHKTAQQLKTIRQSSITTKAKKLASTAAKTLPIKALGKVAKVESDAFKLGHRTVDNAFNNAASKLSKTSKAENLNFEAYASENFIQEVDRQKLLEGIEGLTEIQKEKLLGSALAPDLSEKDLNKIFERLNINPEIIERLKKEKFFNVDLFEKINRTTVPAAHLSYIEKGSVLSAPGKNGFLRNITVREKNGNKVIIDFWEGNKLKTEVIDYTELYQPLKRDQKILYQDSDGSYISGYISEIGDNDMVEIIFGSELKQVKMSELKLKGRSRTLTSSEDLSPKLMAMKAQALIQEYDNFRYDFSINGTTPKVIEKNNILVRKLQEEFSKQGVSTTIATRPNESIYYLSLNAVHPNGNKHARLYVKAQEKLSHQSFTISPYETMRRRALGSSNTSGKTEVGFDSAIHILRKDKNETPVHELRHQSYNNQINNNDNSPLQHYFDTENATHDLYGTPINRITGKNPEAYSDFMSLQELDTHISDVVSMARKLPRLTGGTKDYVLSLFYRKLKRIDNLSNNTNSLITKFDTNFDEAFEKGKYIDEEGVYSISDEFDRELHIKIPPKTQALREGTLKYIDPVDVSRLEQEIKSLAPKAQKDLKSYIDFLKTHPTEPQVIQFERQNVFKKNKKDKELAWNFIQSKLFEAQKERSHSLIRQEAQKAVKGIKLRNDQVAEKMNAIKKELQNNARDADQVLTNLKPHLSELRLRIRGITTTN